MHNKSSLVARRAIALALLLAPQFVFAAPSEHPRSELIGVWQGTSTCTDRVAAPACRDEVVVYEFTAGSAPGVVHWKADKVVNGVREAMGEFDVSYDRKDQCWRGEFKSPRVHSIWSLTVKGTRMEGNAIVLPDKQVIRKIEAQRK